MKTTKASFEKKKSRYTLALTLDILARFVLFFMLVQCTSVYMFLVPLYLFKCENIQRKIAKA